MKRVLRFGIGSQIGFFVESFDVVLLLSDLIFC